MPPGRSDARLKCRSGGLSGGLAAAAGRSVRVVAMPERTDSGSSTAFGANEQEKAPPKRRRLNWATKLLLVLLVVFAVLGLVLHGLASTLAWILFLLAIVSIIGADPSPKTNDPANPFGQYHQ